MSPIGGVGEGRGLGLSSLQTSMSDVISFVFVSLSGSFIRSDRKTLIIKRGGGTGRGRAILDGVCV